MLIGLIEPRANRGNAIERGVADLGVFRVVGNGAKVRDDRLTPGKPLVQLEASLGRLDKRRELVRVGTPATAPKTHLPTRPTPQRATSAASA